MYVLYSLFAETHVHKREKQQGRLAVGGGLGREAIRVMSGMLLLYNSRHLGLPSFDLQSSSGLTHSTSEHSAATRLFVSLMYVGQSLLVPANSIDIRRVRNAHEDESYLRLRLRLLSIACCTHTYTHSYEIKLPDSKD